MDKMKKVAESVAEKKVKAHEKRMHAKGMKKGGVTSMEMKSMGRNMARVMNQRSSGRGR
jgi:hypothetical protein